jgi:hypothetical protein
VGTTIGPSAASRARRFVAEAFSVFLKRLLSLFVVGDRLLSLTASESFSLSSRRAGTGAFLVVDHFPFAFSLNPAGFSLVFAECGAR